MKRAVVLMAVYNGEKYIQEQLDSLFNQTYQNVEIYVRDDGSKDTTPDIIKRNIKEHKNLHLCDDGRHLGYPDCFYELVRMNIEADYFFFADQDDYWLKDKIEKAVLKIEELENSGLGAVCYYCNYVVCDSLLNKSQAVHKSRRRTVNLVNTLFEVPGLEFTMGLNHAAMHLLLENLPCKSSGRGTWMAMLFSALGTIVCDENAYALYRRHETAVTAKHTDFMGIWRWRIHKFLRGDGLFSYKEVICDIKRVYYKKLNQKDKKLVDLFAADSSFRCNLKKAFYPHRLRSRTIDELGLRFLFLTGKL